MNLEFLTGYLDWIYEHLRSSWPWLEIYLLILVGTIATLVIILELFAHRRLLQDRTVCLELTPPAFTDRTPLATEQLFAVLHHLRVTRTFMGRLKRQKIVISLEIASTKKDGIRFIARIPESLVDLFRQSVEAYLPDVKVQKIEDYLASVDPDDGQIVQALSFKQFRHYAYPLNTPAALAQHDPAAYVTGAMTKLEPNELVAFQVVLSPARIASANRIRNKLMLGKEPNLSTNHWLLPFRVGYFFMRLIARTGMAIIGFISEVTAPSTPGSRRYYDEPVYIPTPPTAAAQAVTDSLNDKLAQPLFQTSIRALIVTNSKQQAKQRSNGISSSLAAFRVPGYQALVSRSRFPKTIKQWYRSWQFRYRLPSLLPANACVLNSTELAALYHFPHSVSAKTQNVVKSLSKTLPATIALKNDTPLDVLIGENIHHGQATPIGLTEAERERHMYIIGGTGNGKTTMLLYSIIQDIQNGKGLAVIDPHGDLATTILEHIPADRIKDVIYLNPDDINHPIGINLLELPEGASEDDLIREKDLVTERVISVLRKVFSDDDTGGHRIEYILRNTIHTAFTVEKASIFTIFRLLTDDKFRKATARNLEEGDLKNFWKNELGKAGEFQRVKMSAGVTAKIGRFLFSAPAKRMLEQDKSTINFDTLMQERKILICNFSKGQVGEDTSALFGTTILAKLQLSALRRARTEQTERTPFYIYVDEFQNFATMSFVQMLSEARKYKVFLTMAEQSTSQQDQQRLVDIILANVGTVVAFRSGSPADERFILPLFRQFIDEGEIANLPAYSFYARIAALDVQEPVSGKTVLLEKLGNKKVAKQVIEHSRAAYAKHLQQEPTKKNKSRLHPDLEEPTTQGDVNIGQEALIEIE